MNPSFTVIVAVACCIHIQLPTYSDACQSIICGNSVDQKVTQSAPCTHAYSFQMSSSLNVPICFCFKNNNKNKTKRLSSWTQPLAAAFRMLQFYCKANILSFNVVSRANRKHVIHGGERGHAGADGSDGHV